MTVEQTAVLDAYITGLRNAHGLEKQALQIMNRQIDRMTDYPDLVARLKTHVAETDRQVSRLDAILARHSESHSAVKDTVMSFMGNLAALGHVPAEDEILKNTFADLAFESYEIAAYKSLICMAGIAGDTAGAASLTESLREEEAMADWIDGNIAAITERYLVQSRAA